MDILVNGALMLVSDSHLCFAIVLKKILYHFLLLAKER